MIAGPIEDIGTTMLAFPLYKA
ncbi:protein of unknown function [Methanocaldococcus lauensis]|nr:protein of unknown function [Methanocaldococcus lauensis]